MLTKYLHLPDKTRPRAELTSLCRRKDS